ncbi:hypothetical protein NG895_05055 [Aeoliella sp. ICT_H6.2]|uniref:Uncharacterized protein n=1 Tax=Aeoliella straminimaris TaxID=2954799 RepID=A0A9X2F800_9BACT|nr:hypothetical protein [Aeoliella straminimaris]MCO6043267.1 hypothetical protein [Aeoliella straminimaris]
MMEREREQIDQIVSEIADIGVSADRIQRLESLLLDRPELQAHYASMIRLGTLLRCEIGDGSLQPFGDSSDLEDAPSSLAQHSCATLIDRVGRDVAEPFERPKLSMVLASLAAMVVIGLGWYFLHLTNDQMQGTVPQMASTETLRYDWSQDASGDLPLNSLRVRDARALEVLSRLTRTDAINCLWLPRCESKGTSGEQDSRWELSGGTAWIDSTFDGRERGYVISIPPGVRMDLSVDTDATCQNALGMVELNEQGKISGASMSFNNLSAGNSPVGDRLTGCIGQYSVTNDKATRKNFLIAGSYCVERPDGSGDWKQSDYALLYESADFLVIGFDDSGYPDVEIGEEVDRDRDFNDMCALIHFSGPGAPASPVSSGVSYVPEPIGDPANRVEKRSGYVLDVRPGEKVLLAVSSSANLQNSVRFIDTANRQVVWQHDGTEPGTLTSSFQQGQRGIYIIYNNSDTVRSYEIQGRSITDADRGEGGWIDSPHSVTDEGDNWVSIGFEDSPEIPKRVDWNDIRVHAWWYAD